MLLMVLILVFVEDNRRHKRRLDADGNLVAVLILVFVEDNRRHP